MSTRTQIYLDDTLREALKLLAASRSSTVSELIRRAVTRLLDEELNREDLVSQLDGVVDRLRASRAGVSLSDPEVDAAVAASRKRRGVV
jgi:predicted transcriptional regulator